MNGIRMTLCTCMYVYVLYLFGASLSDPKYTRDRKRFYIMLWGDHFSEKRGKGMKLEKVSAGLHWEVSGPQLTSLVDLFCLSMNL